MLNDVKPMKKIIHIDADCFFAALEMRKNTRLKDIPIAVGGDPGRRGVIATCNYMARQFGVRSAMASAYAKRLCPSLEILKPDFDLYRQVSAQMREVFHRYSDVVEPLSLDEAYLDVSQSDHFGGSATLIAEDIRKSIAKELGITVSAGVAPVKFLAKIASDWRKPDGLFTVVPDSVETFVAQLPLSLLPGVGKVTAEKLARHGLHNCQDIIHSDPEFVLKRFGSFGVRLMELSKGVDNNVVHASNTRKSISIERTYPEDVSNVDELSTCLSDLISGLEERFSKLSTKHYVSKKFVKLKFDNFEQTTMETTISRHADLFSMPDFQRLMQSGWHRQKRGVRLMGVGFRLTPLQECAEQLVLPFISD